METYILFLALFSIIFLVAIVHISLKKCKRLFRKHFPVTTQNKDHPSLVGKDSTAPLLSEDEVPPLIPLEVVALNQNSHLLSAPSVVPSSNASNVPFRSSMASGTCKTITKRVRFAEEEATYIVSTETKCEGRFLVTTSSWAVDTSTQKEKDTRKPGSPPPRRASISACVDDLLRTEPGVDETVIMPQEAKVRRASVV